MPNRFVQIHFLTSYPAALLNRDDVGYAKRIPFGGAIRTRISSQCLKRHWRTFEGVHALTELDVPKSIRSRVTFDRFIRQPLLDEGVDQTVARNVISALMAVILGKSVRAKKAEEEEGKKGEEKEEEQGQGTGYTGQVTILGRPEVEFLLQEARQVCNEKPKDAKTAEQVVKNRFKGKAGKNLKALRHAAGLDAALFGRMVTSDFLARGDAAVHVAHALTVHEEESESDYFSAVDDLLVEEEAKGSGHIGNVELTSGLYYGYAVVDLPLLVSNLEGCEQREWLSANRELASKVVERLVHLVATVSPGAKLGSTGAHSWAQCVLVETGSAQPRTLANAFLKPVPPRPDLLENTYKALAAHLADLDRMYTSTNERRIAGVGAIDVLKETCGTAEPLDAIARWAGAQVKADS